MELVLTNQNVDLIRERVDLAIRIGSLADSGLIVRPVGQVRAVVFASPDYLARRGCPRKPTDLSRHDVVFISRRPEPLKWRFQVSGREQSVRLTPRFMVTEVEAALDAVRGGRGIGRSLSYQVADDFSSGALVRLLRKFELPSRSVQIVVPSARHMSRAVRAFLDHAVRGLEALDVIHEPHR
jgi:DNA-binding transcriptional LysR family regulator